MTSRQDILERVRRQRIAEFPYPGDFVQGIVYDDPVAHFRSMLEGIGGRCASVASPAEATTLLETIPDYAEAATTCSLTPGIGRSTFELTDVNDPHELADVDYAVLPGELAVAENAAVWVTTADVNVRTLYFLTQHLALVVPQRCIVSNMHQAYEQLSIGVHPFGTWISGPSKTADIEQSLVKGAHGARSLLVLLMQEG